MKDYYKILQVDPEAESDVITAAYRRLARKYHPDVYKEADATAKMQEINEAYEVLGDEEKRQRYDRQNFRKARPKAAEPAPKIIVSPSSLDLGTMKFGETRTGEIRITNEGSPINGIVSFQSSVDFLEINTSGSDLPMTLYISVKPNKAGIGTHRVFIHLSVGEETFTIPVKLVVKQNLKTGITPLVEESEPSFKSETSNPTQPVEQKPPFRIRIRPVYVFSALAVATLLTLLFWLLYRDPYNSPGLRLLIASLNPNRRMMAQAQYNVSGGACAVTWSSDNMYLAYMTPATRGYWAGFANYEVVPQTLHIADAINGRDTFEAPLTIKPIVSNQLVFSPDGRSILLSNVEDIHSTLGYQAEVRVFSLRTWSFGDTVTINLGRSSDILRSEVAWSSDGKSFAVYATAGQQRVENNVHYFNLSETEISPATALTSSEYIVPYRVGTESAVFPDSSLNRCYSTSPNQQYAVYVSYDGNWYHYSFR